MRQDGIQECGIGGAESGEPGQKTVPEGIRWLCGEVAENETAGLKIKPGPGQRL